MNPPGNPLATPSRFVKEKTLLFVSGMAMTGNVLVVSANAESSEVRAPIRMAQTNRIVVVFHPPKRTPWRQVIPWGGI